jgi:transcription initiation factor TFIIH subunit 3
MKADETGNIKPRMLIISVSPDSPYQYISIMNCIFSAQKLVREDYSFYTYIYI